MSSITSGGVQRFQTILTQRGWPHQLMELPQSTRTASDAAAAVGCAIGQIAKSLVFRGATTGDPLLVIASGQHRVDEECLAAYMGETIVKPDAAYVRQVTGYVIGGVPPFGHLVDIRTVIDEALLAFDGIWAAAGSPNAVFRLSPADLVAMTGGQVIMLSADA